MRSFIFLIFLFTSNILCSQSTQFNGFWTKVNTTYIFEFELILNDAGPTQVEGYFNWRLVKYDEKDRSSQEYYGKKIGLRAREYVKGTFDAKSNVYKLKGYKKDDPDNIIGIDTYNIRIVENGQLKGTTNANGSWLGRINGRKSEIVF